MPPCKTFVPVTQNDVRHFCRHVWMSGSATPAMQSAWEPVFKTFENERFCSFPHRHGDATWKAENRDETCWSLRAQNKHFVWDFLRFSHFVATKSTFSYEFSQICYFKIDVSCETSVSFHHISQNPSLLPNLHVVTTWRSPDITTLKTNAQHDTSKVLRLPRKMSKVLHLPRKMQLIFWKRRKSIATQKYCACHAERLWTRYMKHGMSRSATPAGRNDATQR